MGWPFTSRNSLSAWAPIRLLWPAATIMAEVIRLWGSSPIEDLQLQQAAAIEMVDLWREGQIEPANRQRAIARAPPHRLTRGSAISNPHLHVLLLHPDALKRFLMAQFARDELDHRVPLAHWLQAA